MNSARLSDKAHTTSMYSHVPCVVHATRSDGGPGEEGKNKKLKVLHSHVYSTLLRVL